MHTLKHNGPTGVLDTMRTTTVAHLNVPVVAESLAYLEKRVAHMQREEKCQRPIQPKRAATVPAVAEAVASSPVQPVSQPIESKGAHKPAANHPWRRKNTATKARIAQAARHAKG